MRPPDPKRDERGIALVIALLVLLVMSMLAVVLMTTVTVESKITGHGMRSASALNIAEAGIAEALSQIRTGDVDLDNDPRAVYQIFNAAAGSVPTLGVDSTALPTQQPAGQWLDYSTASASPRALTVEYRTNSARTLIYKYDVNKNPAIQTASGFPIFRVTSTGVRGADTRTVVGEFIQKPIDVNAKGAVVADVGIDFSGNSEVCGHNHNIDTPAGTRGRPPCDGWEVGYGDLPGAWSTGTINTGGASNQEGNPPRADGQTGFYSGPWSVFNMTQSQFYSWLGAPQWPAPEPPVGITYVDNNGTTQDKSATGVNFNGGDGEGLLYIDGDVTINGDFNFRGLIYIEGDLKINGNVWILGGVVVKGATTIKIANGDLTVLYSGDSIQQKISQHGQQFVNISWREL